MTEVKRSDYIAIRDGMEEVVDIMYKKKWIMAAISFSDADRLINEHMRKENEHSRNDQIS